MISKIGEAIDFAQSHGHFNNLVISSDFNMKKLKWSDGLMQLEVGMCAKSKIIASFMNEQFLQNHVNIPTRQNNILHLIMSNCPDYFFLATSETYQKFSDHDLFMCEFLMVIGKN